MAVAAYTYDKLPASEQQALPNESHFVAALEWADPDEGQAESTEAVTPTIEVTPATA